MGGDGEGSATLRINQEQGSVFSPGTIRLQPTASAAPVCGRGQETVRGGVNGKAVNAGTEQAQGSGAPARSNLSRRRLGKQMPELNLWFTHTLSLSLLHICVHMHLYAYTHSTHMCVLHE